MPDEKTYGFHFDDAQSLLQSIETVESGYVEIKPRGGSSETAVILDAELPAATNAKTSPTSCLATVCEWNNTDSEYSETSKQITVWNHSESTAHVINTFGVARWINGHFHFFGDCEAMASR